MANIYFALFAISLCGPVFAFPPAPHHLIYGIVRDELGHPITVPGAEVILEAGIGAPVKASIVHGLHPGINYKLEIPMDTAVTSERYKRTALGASVPFKLRVRIGKAVYVPIEMTGEFSTLGDPAQATRIDLTLGEDSDGDGLPDAWERALIAASGGKLTDLRPGDDSDSDGQSNLNEYLAGTYAFDSKNGFSLKIIDSKVDSPILEFISIRGRTYSVFASSDLSQWTQVPFRLTSDTPTSADRRYYEAGDSSVIQVLVHPTGDLPKLHFFKLRVE